MLLRYKSKDTGGDVAVNPSQVTSVFRNRGGAPSVTIRLADREYVSIAEDFDKVVGDISTALLGSQSERPPG